VDGSLVPFKDPDLPKAPEGKSYYMQIQTLSAEDYEKIGMGDCQVSYDANDPNNSDLDEATNPKFATLFVLTPVLIVFGLVLILFSVKSLLFKTAKQV